MFRYENGNDRGFVLAQGFFDNRRRRLPAAERSRRDLNWETIFPNAKRPTSQVVLVVVWATWGSHSAYALLEANKAAATFRATGADVTIAAAVEPTSGFEAANRVIRGLRVNVDTVSLSMRTLPLTWAHNQIPAVLMFREGTLVGRRLGAQDASQLVDMAGASY